MKCVIFGFEFKIGLRPTTETRIRYFSFLNHIRCRLFHDSTWTPNTRGANETYRWYCCRNCKTVWSQKMTGYGDKV